MGFSGVQKFIFHIVSSTLSDDFRRLDILHRTKSMYKRKSKRWSNLWIDANTTDIFFSYLRQVSYSLIKHYSFCLHHSYDDFLHFVFLSIGWDILESLTLHILHISSKIKHSDAIGINQIRIDLNGVFCNERINLICESRTTSICCDFAYACASQIDKNVNVFPNICCPRAICSRFLKKKTFDSPLRKICRCLLKKTLLLEPVQVQKIRPSKRCCQKVYLDTNLAFGRCDAQQTPSTITLPQQKQQIVSNKYTHTHHKIIPHLITILVQCVFDKQSAKSTLKSNAWWMHSITVLIVLR